MIRHVLLIGSVSLLVLSAGHLVFHYLLFTERLVRFVMF